MRKICRQMLVTGALCLSSLLAACQSLPEGASAPQLTVHSVELDNRDSKNTYFSVKYSLHHSSLTPLQLKEVKSEVFLNGIRTAQTGESFGKDGLTVLPGEDNILEIKVPLNTAGAAAADSLKYNRPLIMQGSCVVQAFFTEDETHSYFNPSDSLVGLIGTVR